MAGWIAISTAETLIPGRVYQGLTGQPMSPMAAAAIQRTEHPFRPGSGTVSPRTVYIPENAFNAGTAFTSFFAATAVVGDALVVKTANALKKMPVYAPDIRGELGAQVTAVSQGWPAEGFGGFIYNFLRQEIDDNGGEASVGRHAFYVYNPTTSADVVFRDKVRNQPLPPSFGGFSADIEAIFRLMWTNRQTLRDTMSRDAADAVVFHLLVPAMSTMAVLDRTVIGESVGRLVIKGHMEEGSCYAWFNFARLPRRVTLHEVRNLNTDADEHKTKTRILKIGNILAACCVATLIAVMFGPSNSGLYVSLAITTLCVLGVAQYILEWWYEYIPPRVLGPAPDDSWDIAAWPLMLKPGSGWDDGEVPI